MADANRLIEIQLKKIEKVIERGCKLILAEKIKEKLIENIFDNFYDKYDMGDKGWLVDSLSIKVKPIENLRGFSVEVFWKDKPLSHTTWWGSSKLGVKANSKVYTVEWVNKGYTFLSDGSGRRINEVGKVKFIEKTIEELEFDDSWLQDFYEYLQSNGIDINK